MIQKTIKLSLFLILIGTLLFVLSLFDFTSSMNDLKFIETKGRITRFEHLKKRPRQVNEEIALEYEYAVNGVSYKNSKFSNGVGDIYQFENYYKKGQIIPVYYNPNNYSESVLVKGGRYFKFDGLMIIGSITILWGLIGVGSLRCSFLRKIWNSMNG